MATSVLICDDSRLAQKQMLRALPSDWDVDVSFANHGEEALEALREGKGDVLFLDLNMPVLDGYETLKAIRQEGLSARVIVVSGDIQPEAYERVMGLGAVAFIKKPIDNAQLLEVLDSFDLCDEQTIEPKEEIQVKVGLRDCYQEIANLAMGRAADFLARLLDAFVIMPIPNVNMIEVSELRMALNQVGAGDTVSAVCQGFIGSGVAGEALLLFNESSFKDIAELLKHEGKIDESVEMELLMDISNVLIGACLKGIVDQLDISFSQGHPMVIGRHVRISDVLKGNASRWQRTFAIEMGYRIENRHINCDLLLLFTEDSMEALQRHVWHMMS